MRRLLIWCAVLILCVIPGCRAGAPLQRPTPQQPPAAPQAAGASQPPVQGAVTDVPELAHGPEDGGRPHYDPATPPAGAYMRGDPNLKLVALTFDDAPDGVFTPRVLDVLRANHAPATFFVVGNRATAHPEIVRRMAAEGHEVGNHSYNHPRLTKIPEPQVTHELNATDSLLRKLTGRPVRAFRPPYGESNPVVLRAVNALGYRLVLWDIDSLDWKRGMTAHGVIENVVPNIKRGAIILQHAAGGKGEDLTDTVQALPAIIKSLRAQGYRLVTVSELLSTGQARPGLW